MTNPCGDFDVFLKTLNEKNYEKLYNELIYAVGKKWPNETRHETALRYILEAEHVDSTPQAKENVKIASAPTISSTNDGGFMMSWNVRDIIFGPNR